MKHVCVVDGQGDGIGTTIIKALKERISLVGASREPLPHLVEEKLKEYVKEVLKDV